MPVTVTHTHTLTPHASRFLQERAPSTPRLPLQPANENRCKLASRVGTVAQASRAKPVREPEGRRAVRERTVDVCPERRRTVRVPRAWV